MVCVYGWSPVRQLDFMKTHSNPISHSPRGFTLVEIMIVVVIIGLLATLAVPAFARVRDQSRITTFVSDLRTGAQAFETYAMEQGTWPPDGSGGVPNVMRNYLSLDKFGGATPLGGQWDWDEGVFGYTAGLSADFPTADAATFQQVDAAIDDGDLSTGNFRERTNGYIYVLEF